MFFDFVYEIICKICFVLRLCQTCFISSCYMIMRTWLNKLPENRVFNVFFECFMNDFVVICTNETVTTTKDVLHLVHFCVYILIGAVL